MLCQLCWDAQAVTKRTDVGRGYATRKRCCAECAAMFDSRRRAELDALAVERRTA